MARRRMATARHALLHRSRPRLASARCFLLLAIYGAFSGVTQELAALGSGYTGYNIAGFPHQEALGLGRGSFSVSCCSHVGELFWIVARLANTCSGTSHTFCNDSSARRTIRIPDRNCYRLALARSDLSALWLSWLSGIVARSHSVSKTSAGPLLRRTPNCLRNKRRSLIVLTVCAAASFNIFPALRTIYYLPVQGPVSGLFSWFGDDVSYGLPLVLAALVMIGYAVRERMT